MADGSAGPSPNRTPHPSAPEQIGGRAGAGGGAVLFVGPRSSSGASTEQAVRRGGLALRRVPDFLAAEAELKANSVDLIVLDSGPGGEIDFGGCHCLAALDAGPLLVVSDRNDETDRARALDLGAQDCLPPGCGDAERLARVRALARGGGSRRKARFPGGRILTFGPFQLDMEKRELRSDDGGEQGLPPSEFGILLLLLNNPGRVMTSHDLRIASHEAPRTHRRTLAVKIHRLRRRLDPSGHCRPLIRTVHGVGYQLDATVAPLPDSGD